MLKVEVLSKVPANLSTPSVINTTNPFRRRFITITLSTHTDVDSELPR